MHFGQDMFVNLTQKTLLNIFEMNMYYETVDKMYQTSTGHKFKKKLVLHEWQNVKKNSD